MLLYPVYVEENVSFKVNARSGSHPQLDYTDFSARTMSSSNTERLNKFLDVKTHREVEDILKFIISKNNFAFYIFCKNHCHGVLESTKGIKLL